jgi:hypothetical protein
MNENNQLPRSSARPFKQVEILHGFEPRTLHKHRNLGWILIWFQFTETEDLCILVQSPQFLCFPSWKYTSSKEIREVPTFCRIAVEEDTFNKPRELGDRNKNNCVGAQKSLRAGEKDVTEEPQVGSA